MKENFKIKTENHRIIKPDQDTHTNNGLFTLLMSGKRYRSNHCSTTGLQSRKLLYIVQHWAVEWQINIP